MEHPSTNVNFYNVSEKSGHGRKRVLEPCVEVREGGSLVDAVEATKSLLLMLSANKALGAGCWRHSTCSSCPLGRFLCVPVFIFALLLFSWQFVCIWPKGAEHLTLPSKRWASTGPAGRKGCPYLVSDPTLYRASHFPVSVRALHDSNAPWSGAPVGRNKPCGADFHGGSLPCPPPSSPPASLSQGWFHLRSSCLCCSLITLNFLEGDDTLYHEDSSSSAWSGNFHSSLWSLKCVSLWESLTFLVSYSVCLPSQMPFPE